MRVALFDVGGKALYLKQRLEAAGHTTVGTVKEADVCLLDCDWRWAHPRPAIAKAAAEAGVPVVLYPHGGQPQTFVYDGLTDPDPNVTLRFEHGPGNLQIAAHMHQVLNQRVTGWLFSPTAPFEPVLEPRKVLFAPQHPNMEMLLKGTSNGSDPGPALNQPVYKQLLQAGYEVTVSVVGPLFRNGIWPHPNVRVVENNDMYFPATIDLILDADVVVAAGTIAAAAVALGKPTVMIGQTDLTDYVDGRYQEAKHADQYRELIRYPLDVSTGELEPLIDEACAGSPWVDEWRRLFVGDDGTGKAIEILGEFAPSIGDVTIGGVTARASGLGG